MSCHRDHLIEISSTSENLEYTLPFFLRECVHPHNVLNGVCIIQKGHDQSQKMSEWVGRYLGMPRCFSHGRKVAGEL
jgi:hypothetical protein